MAKLIVAHMNTESKELDLGNNDKVSWIVIIKNDGTREYFFKSEDVQPTEQDLDFLEGTRQLIEENKDIEVALSKIGEYHVKCPYVNQYCEYYQPIGDGTMECIYPDSHPDNPECPIDKEND